MTWTATSAAPAFSTSAVTSPAPISSDLRSLIYQELRSLAYLEARPEVQVQDESVQLNIPDVAPDAAIEWGQLADDGPAPIEDGHRDSSALVADTRSHRWSSWRTQAKAVAAA